MTTQFKVRVPTSQDFPIDMLAKTRAWPLDSYEAYRIAHLRDQFYASHDRIWLVTNDALNVQPGLWAKLGCDVVEVR